MEMRVNGEEPGIGDEEKRGDDEAKGTCVSSDTPELFTFRNGVAKAPTRAISNMY